MDLVVDSGINGGAPTWEKFYGTLLAIPVIMYGLSSVLTVAGFFVVETWNGFPFLHTVWNLDGILVDWVTLIMMLGVPIFTMICSLFARLENWWSISFYTWFASMSFFFWVFSLVVIYYEIQAAWLMVEELNEKSRMSIIFFLSDCVRRRQYSMWCGHQEKVRISAVDKDELEPSPSLVTRWYTSLTLTKCCDCLFEVVDPPERIYSLEEILGRRKFVSRHNWSMERILCSNRRDESIAVIRGPAALRKSQIISSLVCVSVAVIGVVLLVLGFMLWAGRSTRTTVLIVLLIFCCCFPRFQTAVRFMRMYRQIEEFDGAEAETRTSEDGLYQSFETYRVSRPKKSLRFFLFILAIGLFFIWPVATLIYVGEWVAERSQDIVSLAQVSLL
jgi:hypothetical protein